MIRIEVPFYPNKNATAMEQPNSWVYILDQWKFWAAFYGLEYLTGGSMREDLEPGYWMVQSYHGEGSERRNMRHRDVCFHPKDRTTAILFKLTWA